MRLRFLVSSLICLAPAVAAYSQTTVFVGTPSLKITEEGSARQVDKLTEKEARDYRLVITQDGDRYLWASRKNIVLIQVVSGSYVTFVATNGSGYIRTYAPHMFEALSQMSLEDQKSEQFHYVEHLTVMLGSVTYYGKRD
jgi:hypothetical protein